MNKYTCILFDLDGTLANTFPGILHSYQYAAKKMGLTEPNEKIVGEAIGAPLAEVFIKRFNLNVTDASLAMTHYRQYYMNNGVIEVEPYNGIKETLSQLKSLGFYLGVTTLKKESFAIEIINRLDIAQNFDVIIGMDENDILTKSQMIKKALDLLQQKPESALLVGDSSYDAIGAKEANIDFIAVTYGFGFKQEEDAATYDHVAIIKAPLQLVDKVK